MCEVRLETLTSNPGVCTMKTVVHIKVSDLTSDDLKLKAVILITHED